MAVGRTNAAAKGGGIDYNTKPQITFDGKWSGWYVEFYAGVPYWEAVFYSSGTLSVSGSYTADVWMIGAGAWYGSNQYGADKYRAGCGHVAQKNGVSASGNSAVTIGAPVRYKDGGSTSILGVTAAGGSCSEVTQGVRYRFGDPDKAAEAGDNNLNYNNPSNMTRGAQGGWLHWTSGEFDSASSGAGYGAGGGYYSGGPDSSGSHVGAAVIRIAV